ncbi:MAG: tetratricopeptide repeat protein, partial [Candidatus Odinarchaeia archaeon]
HDLWKDICFDKLQRAKEMANDFDLIWEEMGLYYLLILNFEEAEKNFKKAYTMNLACETIRYNLGLLYQKRGFYEEAIKYFNEALEIDPKYNLARKHITICKAKILIDEGISLQRTGKYQEALNKYYESLQLNPTDPEAKRKIDSVIKQMNKKKIIQLKQLIENKDYANAERLLDELLDSGVVGDEIKKLQYQLLELLHQEDIGKQQIAKKQKDRGDSLILISVLEALRNKHMTTEEILTKLYAELPKLSIEKQKAVLNNIKKINESNEKPLKEFDSLLKTQLDSIGITKSKYIPSKIDTSGMPIDTWLTININNKIRRITQLNINWDSTIPTILQYDSSTGKLLKEDGVIKEKAITLIDRLSEGPTAYQIKLLKSGSFALLKAKKYAEVNYNNKRVKEWVFDFINADIHDPLIQLHRYEIDYNLTKILKENTNFQS